jgi:hypothetical protein
MLLTALLQFAGYGWTRFVQPFARIFMIAVP